MIDPTILFLLGAYVVETVACRFKPEWGARLAFIPFGAERSIEGVAHAVGGEESLQRRALDARLVVPPDENARTDRVLRLMGDGRSAAVAASWPHQRRSRCWGILRFDLRASADGGLRLVPMLAPAPFTQLLLLAALVAGVVLQRYRVDVLFFVAGGAMLYWNVRSILTLREVEPAAAADLIEALTATLGPAEEGSGEGRPKRRRRSAR